LDHRHGIAARENLNPKEEIYMSAHPHAPLPFKISVGKVILPLHGSANGNPSAQMAHHMAMQQMAGTNFRGEPRGFRIAPTSRKNPKTHSKKPATRLEVLGQLVYGEE